MRQHKRSGYILFTFSFITTPFGAGDGTPGLMCAKQTLNHKAIPLAEGHKPKEYISVHTLICITTTRPTDWNISSSNTQDTCTLAPSHLTSCCSNLSLPSIVSLVILELQVVGPHSIHSFRSGSFHSTKRIFGMLTFKRIVFF